MSKRSFSAVERYAVFTVHGERCYMCSEPLDLQTMEVDHVIPEALLSEPVRLASVLENYGLPPDFDLQSWSNWLPACGPCNNRKRNRVFRPTTRVQLDLEIAAEKADDVHRLAENKVSQRAAARAVTVIQRLTQDGRLDEVLLAQLKDLISLHEPVRTPERRGEAIRLAPNFEILSEKDGVRLVRGPYGVGAGPIVFDERSNFRCPTCGNVAWSGPRCVVCGAMDDE